MQERAKLLCSFFSFFFCRSPVLLCILAKPHHTGCHLLWSLHQPGSKLSPLAISTPMCNWLLDFLTNRPQSMKVRNTISISLSIRSPQGCVMGPLLFRLLTRLLRCICLKPHHKVCRWCNSGGSHSRQWPVLKRGGEVAGGLVLWELPDPECRDILYNSHVSSPLSNSSSPNLWSGHRADLRGQGSWQFFGLHNSLSATWTKSVANLMDWLWQSPFLMAKKHRGGNGLWVSFGWDPFTSANVITHTGSGHVNCPKGDNSPRLTSISPPQPHMCD